MLNIDFWYRERCPYCNKEFHPGDCPIISTRYQENGKPKVIRPAPQGVGRLIARLRQSDSLDGPQYVLMQAAYACPYCLNPLPLRESENLTIAIIGDTTSGKSHFIAALVYQMQTQYMAMVQDVAVSFMAATQQMGHRYYSQYYSPVFIEKGALPFNPLIVPAGPLPPLSAPPETNTDPLVFKLTIGVQQRALRHIKINIYDVAGEDLIDQQRFVTYYPQLLNADGIIFLADPRNLPYADSLIFNSSQQSSSGSQGGGTMLQRRSPSEGFHWVKETFQGYRQEFPLRIPVAIALSKADMLRYNRPPGNPYRFNINPVYKDFIDMEDLRRVDADVREIIMQGGDGTLLREARTSSIMVHFFATSATGHSADAQGKFPAIEPCRCIDPLLWILRQRHLI